MIETTPQEDEAIWALAKRHGGLAILRRDPDGVLVVRHAGAHPADEREVRLEQPRATRLCPLCHGAGCRRCDGGRMPL